MALAKQKMDGNAGSVRNIKKFDSERFFEICELSVCLFFGISGQILIPQGHPVRRKRQRKEKGRHRENYNFVIWGYF